MKNMPLRLDWDAIFRRGAAPPPELEVVTSDEPAPSEAFPVNELSDHDLETKIRRLHELLDGGFILKRLQDNGAKLHSNLSQFEEEFRRRNLLRKQKDSEARGRTTQLKIKSSTDVISNLDYSRMSSKTKSSSVFHFSKKLEDKPAKTSFRGLPFRFLLGVKKDRFSNGGQTDSGSSNSSLYEKRKFSGRILRRQVKDFVILDEEAHSTQPVNETMFHEWREAKVYYPSRDDPESVELSYSDIKCLDPGSYLTSTIMNFYIQYLQRSLSSISRARDKYYIFNTYFYEKLKEAHFCEGDKGASFLKLRRWWKGVNIFQKSYIFLPIHGHSHWSLVIICIPAKEDESGPIILHLDSLGIHSSHPIFDIVDSYLIDEWNFVNQSAAPLDIPFSRGIWRCLPDWIEKKKIKVPQQKNEYDCGVFVLYYMERFIREAPERIRAKDLNMFGNKWFQPQEASNLRNRIRALLLEEFESARLDNEEDQLPSSSGCSANCEEKDDPEPDVVESIMLD
ncbi:ubiquitin-like-specific protease 1D isoform X2 [Dioscorea cayenensis subsp. rotundata]|uniref:Ubiquitin-like-specific protease 1D isoform X2 n=1 Tax=Dioscorea cayennensis subsp. rotundata TaxID=55577 RepID=A0AB40B5K1_DIOCR|nr:ubiquitin-like-specific protease 1D isoform X2 [Dioscorea cayenensis subsp. rotundata]